MGDKSHTFDSNRRSVLKAAGISTIPAFATSGAATNAQQEDKLTYAIPGQSQELNPLTANTPGTRRPLRQICRGLTIIENDLKARPWLAKDWSVDGSTYTFDLREGVQFHPPVSREMTAEDVVATYQWIKNNEEANIYTPFQRFTNIEAPDDYTVRIELDEPFTYTFSMLGEIDAAILPKGYIEDMPDQPVGTGPYQFDERQVGTYTRLRRFEDWWKDMEYPDAVEQRPISEASVRLQELKTGNIHFVTTLAAKDRQEIENSQDLDLQLVENVKTEMVTFNTRVEPFGNSNVRKAIRHAVDSQQALELAAFEFGETTDRPFAGYEDYVPENHPEGQNMEKARSLLSEAGYGDGFETTLQVANAWQRSVRVARPLQQWLSQIGIDMQIQRVTKSRWYDNVFSGDSFEMSSYGYTGTPDGPWVNMHDLYHSNGLVNVGFWEDEQMDEYIGQIARLPNGPERAEATRNALQIAWDRVPKFPIFFHHFLAAKRSNVQESLYWGPAELRLWRNSLSQ
jgi:peptide/nickel transport system substrate-binding protein